MADFDQALKVVLLHEGGYINDPSDLGRATNMGITAATLATFLKQPVSAAQVSKITLEQASDIYKQAYWDESNLSSVNNQELATVIMDLSVLMGVPTCIRYIQEILNITEDGILGSASIAAINQFVSSDWLAIELICATENHFIKICLNNPNQLKFILGWFSRIHDLIRIVFTQ